MNELVAAKVKSVFVRAYYCVLSLTPLAQRSFVSLFVYSLLLLTHHPHMSQSPPPGIDGRRTRRSPRTLVRSTVCPDAGRRGIVRSSAGWPRAQSPRGGSMAPRTARGVHCVCAQGRRSDGTGGRANRAQPDTAQCNQNGSIQRGDDDDDMIQRKEIAYVRASKMAHGPSVHGFTTTEGRRKSRRSSRDNQEYHSSRLTPECVTCCTDGTCSQRVHVCAYALLRKECRKSRRSSRIKSIIRRDSQNVSVTCCTDGTSSQRVHVWMYAPCVHDRTELKAFTKHCIPFLVHYLER